jgi:anti-anti-sigma factor
VQVTSPETHFQVVATTLPGCTVIRACGEVDIAACPELDQRVGQSLHPGSTVVVDLSEATFIDSSCLSQLVRCQRRAEEADTTFRLVLGTEAVRRVFELTALDTAFQIYPSLEKATAELRG